MDETSVFGCNDEGVVLLVRSMLRYHVVIVLRFLGLVVVCWSASEQPTASTPKWAPVFCRFYPPV